MSNFAMAAAMKKRKRMAKGGEPAYESGYGAEAQDGVHNQSAKSTIGVSSMGRSVRQGDLAGAKRVAYQKIKEQRNASVKAKGAEYAEGGETCDDDRDADMIARIMHKRKQYSQGGMAANDDQITADFEPNDFDDLAMRDDLNFEYDADNSGDKLGNEKMDEDDKDIISRIMKSSRKKDRMPRPA